MSDTPSNVQSGLQLQPAVRTSLTSTVAAQLAELIVDDRFESGDRLPSERELANRLQVSRIVVREALRALSERGLVQVKPGVGTFVVPMEQSAVSAAFSLYIRRNRVAMHHLFELRYTLEPALARAAAWRASPEILDAMARNLERTEELTARLEDDDDAVEEFAWSDLEFHQLLASASDNPLNLIVLEPLFDRQLDVRRRGARLPGAARTAFEGHREIREHVSNRNGEGASQAMVRHLETVASWLVPGAQGDEDYGYRPNPPKRSEE